MRYSQQSITEPDIAAVVEVLRSPWLTQGPVVEHFEVALAEYVGAKYAVAVSSGTAALHLAYLAAECMGQGIVTSPLSFVATANAALLADMDVWFRDVEPETGNLTPRERGGSELNALWVPVHYAGRAAMIPRGEDVVEDACHALGAMDYDGCSRVGSCAHSLATCFSFHPVKPITTGEGGAITTNDEGFAKELRLLRSHGRDENGRMVKLGLNYRMNEMSAALGLSQLKTCDERRGRREAIASLYVAAEMERFFRDKAEGPEWQNAGAWHLYPIRIKNGRRDEVKAKLNAQGIGAQIHYEPIHLQPFYRQTYGYKEGDFPEAEAWGREELSLPLHSDLTEQDVRLVCTALKEALG